jgi:predicted secreted protein
MKIIKSGILVFGFLLIAISSSGFSQSSFDLTELESGQLLLNLSATEQVSVEQDTLNASLAYSVQGREKISLQHEVNTKMAGALELVEAISEIEYSTGQYYIYIIRPGRPSRDDIENPIWRAQQGLQLSSTNSEELLEAVGELQSSGMEINRLNYSLSEEAFEQTSDSLLSIALEKLEGKANETAELLNKSSASLVEVTINGNRNTGFFQPRMAMMEGTGEPDYAQFETPTAVPGQSEVSLSVSAKALLSP